MAFTNPIGQVQLAPGTQVGIDGPIDTTGSTVNVTGATLSAGTPTVGTPSAAIRNVSSSAAASSSISATTSGSSTSVLIAAPGAGKKLELHQLGLSIAVRGTTGVAATIAAATVSVIDTTTSAVIAQISGIAFVPTTSSGVTPTQDLESITLDLQGVTLPANHGVTLQLATGFGAAGGSATGTVNALAYTTVV